MFSRRSGTPVRRVGTMLAAVFAASIVLMSVSTTAQASGVSGVSRSTTAQAVTSGSWGADATTTATSAPTNAAYSMSFATNGSSAPTSKLFYVDNTGTLTITGVSANATISPSSSVSSSKSFTLSSCSVAWNQSTKACSGTKTTVMTVTATPTTATISHTLAGAGDVQLLAAFTSSISATTTVSLAISVTRALVRTAATTSS